MVRRVAIDSAQPDGVAETPRCASDDEDAQIQPPPFGRYSVGDQATARMEAKDALRIRCWTRCQNESIRNVARSGGDEWRAPSTCLTLLRTVV